MRKTYKYRIYANKQTLEKAENWLYLCRQLYNVALEQRITAYKQNRKQLSEYGQCYDIKGVKTITEYKDVNAQCLQEVLGRLDKAYKAFFRRVKSKQGKVGFPRFKGGNRYNSFTLKQSGYKLDGKYLSIRNVGKFKLRLSRAIEGNIKTVTIHRVPTGKWYACFSCDNVPEQRLPNSDKAIGIDVGIKSFSVDSEGLVTDNPKYLRQAESILRRRQRKLSRRKKGSNRMNKSRILVAKIYEKVTNQRNNFLHKTANYYIANYGIISVEDLNIKGMVKTHHLAKSISDASWSRFFELLTYKAEEAGREVIKVNPYNTSQICSGCGAKVPKTLAVRIHTCPECGLVLDRDKNAAINISAVGQTVHAKTPALADVA